MKTKRKTMIATGAAEGIRAGVSLISAASICATTSRLAVVRGDICDPSTARQIASTAIETLGPMDGALDTAGIFVSKPFTDGISRSCHVFHSGKRRAAIRVECITNMLRVAAEVMQPRTEAERIAESQLPLAVALASARRQASAASYKARAELPQAQWTHVPAELQRTIARTPGQ